MKAFYQEKNIKHIIGAGLAILFLGRIWSLQIRVFGDNELHLRNIYEAYYEIVNGRFPLRIASHQLLEQGYMTFQYSCNIFYTIMGVIVAAVSSVIDSGLSVGTVVWLVHCCSLFVMFYIAFIYTVAISKSLGVDSNGALASGVLYGASPYMLTNVFARGAVTEAFALYLLPVLVYHLLVFNLGHSSRKSVMLIPALVAVFVGTHLSTAFYLFFTLFIFSFFVSTSVKKTLGSIGLISLGILIDSFFLFSSLIEPPEVSGIGNPGNFLFLLSKWYMPFKTNYASGLDQIHSASFQVGIGPLVTIPLLLIAITAERKKIVFGFAVTLLCLYSLMFCDKAAWNRLPKVFWLLQFSYRLLGLIAFWSSILLPLTLRAGGTIRRYLLILTCVGTIVAGFAYTNSGRGLVDPSSVNKNPQLPWNISDYLPVVQKSFLGMNDGKFNIVDNRLYRDRSIDIKFAKRLSSNSDLYLDIRGWLEDGNCNESERRIRLLNIDGGAVSAVECYHGTAVLHIASDSVNNQSIRISTTAIPEGDASSFSLRTAPRLILAISPDLAKRWLYLPRDGFKENLVRAQANIKDKDLMLILPQIAYSKFSTVLLNGRKVDSDIVRVNAIPLSVIGVRRGDSVAFVSHGSLGLNVMSVLALLTYIIVVIASVWKNSLEALSRRCK